MVYHQLLHAVVHENVGEVTAQFLRQFVVTLASDFLHDGDRGLVEDFIRYAARQGVAPNYRDIARSRKLIEAQLRAYIGRNTALEDNGFYANIYPVDNVIVRAVGILNETREND